MDLFKHNLSNDVIICAAYIQVLFKNDEGIETIVYEISKQNFGLVSQLFKNVVQQEKKGIPVSKNLRQLAKTNIHPYLKTLVSSLISGSLISENLTTLVKSVLQDKKIETDRLIHRIDTMSTWFVLIPFLPIALSLMDLINGTLHELPIDVGIQFDKIFTENIKSLVLLVAGVIFLALMIILKEKKK